MKIVIFVPEFFSLSQTFIIRKVRALAERGESVTVVSFSDSRNKAHKEILKDVRNVNVINIPSDNGTPFRRILVWVFLGVKALLTSPGDTCAFWKLTRHYGSWKDRLKQFRKLLGLVGIRGDVYHFEFGDLAAAYIDYLKSFARPCIVSFRGSDINTYPLANPELASLYREVILHADRIHCTSEEIAHRVAELGGSHKAFINHPAIDASFFAPDSNSTRDPNLVVTVGRLKWVKGLTFALLAISKLVREFPNLHYVLVGDGPSRDELAFYVDNLGIQKNVEFYGRASTGEVKNLLGKASVFLLSSISEGVSNAVLEAMAMEVPVVTTDAGGMAEAIDNGVEGFVTPRYDPTMLAERVKQLLSNEDLRKKIGKNARQRILRDFTIERQVEVFLTEYSNLVASTRQ